MTFFRLLVRNLIYHGRGNFAVFLGVALGSAVLTGALLVGDSLRGSLRALALDQLGWVDEALVTSRFFRAALADEVTGKIAPALVLQGNATGAGKEPMRAGKVTLLAVNERFWPEDALPLDAAFWQSAKDEVVLNETLAQALEAKVGDRISLNVQRAENIPRETLLGKRKAEDVVESLRVTLRAIVPDEGMSRFTLKPSPEPVRNAFVPLRFIQERLELKGRANVLLAATLPDDSQATLAKSLTLDDWGLRLRTPETRARAFVRYLDPNDFDGGRIKRIRWDGRVPEALAALADDKGILTAEQVTAFYRKHRNYSSLESGQMFLDSAVVKAASAVWKARPLLIYLADTIAHGKTEVPYAVVAGIDPADLADLPSSTGKGPLQNNEIILANWPESPFKAKTGDTLTLTYYVLDARNQLEKKAAEFVLRTTMPLVGRADDPDLTPEFKGITDKLDMAKWENPPFPYNPKRVKPADDTFWKRYRTTPRAYVTLETAQRLWGSRFGNVTSLRIEPGDAKSAADFRSRLLQELQPAQGGFVFQKVKELALRAGGGATDFGFYFLMFSFFLIVAALLLVGLLFRLNMDRRAAEMGVLAATGWSQRRVRGLLLGEGAVLAVLGGLVGLAGAWGYAYLMLQYLRARWPGGSNLAFLDFHAEPLSFAIGYVSALVVSFLTIFWATRVLTKMAPRALLTGQTTASVQQTGRRRWSQLILAASILGAGACLAGGLSLEAHAARTGSFFGSGALLLTAGLAALWLWLKRTGKQSTPQPSLRALGIRNAGRQLVRSVLTAGLLAAATFLIVAVESFHKETDRDFLTRAGSSGGFPLLAESDVPIFQDLNTAAARVELDLPDYFEDVRIYPCRLRAGDDASCLNLYQPLQPRLLGMSSTLIQRGGFAFKAHLGTTDEEEKNPWLLLERPAEDGAVPVVADATTAQYMLKVALGGIVEVPNERGEPLKLKVVGLLSESIFQSELLLSEKHFLQQFPRQEGFNFFLIDGPSAQAKDIQSALESGLGDQGFFVSSTAKRVEAYLAVENTYLATFQALGGLGLLLGAVGLGIVLLRAVWERRAELALLRALGFQKGALAWLVLVENLFLLLVGLTIGTVAALAAVAPHLTSSGSEWLWLRLALLLGLVIVVGLGAGLAATIGTLRTPVLTALRRE